MTPSGGKRRRRVGVQGGLFLCANILQDSSNRFDHGLRAFLVEDCWARPRAWELLMVVGYRQGSHVFGPTHAFSPRNLGSFIVRNDGPHNQNTSYGA